MPNSTADDIKNCPRCKSQNLVRETQHGIPLNRYGKLVCNDCHSFVTWLRDLSVDIEVKARDEVIDKVLEVVNLDDWEREFLENVKGCQSLTSKQKSNLDSITLRRLGYRVCTPTPTTITNYQPILPIPKRQPPKLKFSLEVVRKV